MNTYPDLYTLLGNWLARELRESAHEASPVDVGSMIGELCVIAKSFGDPNKPWSMDTGQNTGVYEPGYEASGTYAIKGKRLQVLCATGLVTIWADEPTLAMRLAEESLTAEEQGFDAKSLPSCLHYLCENSFGFSTTHLTYTPEKWLAPIQQAALEYHGPDAYAMLCAAVTLTGMAGYEPEVQRGSTCIDTLLAGAYVASEHHRGVRK